MITKRFMGLLLIYLGSGAIVGVFGLDLLGFSSHDGIGPVQRIILIAAVFVIVVGLTLVPLGKRPA